MDDLDDDTNPVEQQVTNTEAPADPVAVVEAPTESPQEPAPLVMGDLLASPWNPLPAPIAEAAAVLGDSEIPPSTAAPESEAPKPVSKKPDLLVDPKTRIGQFAVSLRELSGLLGSYAEVQKEALRFVCGNDEGMEKVSLKKVEEWDEYPVLMTGPDAAENYLGDGYPQYPLIGLFPEKVTDDWRTSPSVAYGIRGDLCSGVYAPTADSRDLPAGFLKPDPRLKEIVESNGEKFARIAWAFKQSQKLLKSIHDKGPSEKGFIPKHSYTTPDRLYYELEGVWRKKSGVQYVEFRNALLRSVVVDLETIPAFEEMVAYFEVKGSTKIKPTPKKGTKSRASPPPSSDYEENIIDDVDESDYPAPPPRLRSPVPAVLAESSEGQSPGTGETPPTSKVKSKKTPTLTQKQKFEEACAANPEFVVHSLFKILTTCEFQFTFGIAVQSPLSLTHKNIAVPDGSKDYGDFKKKFLEGNQELSRTTWVSFVPRERFLGFREFLKAHEIHPELNERGAKDAQVILPLLMRALTKFLKPSAPRKILEMTVVPPATLIQPEHVQKVLAGDLSIKELEQKLVLTSESIVVFEMDEELGGLHDDEIRDMSSGIRNLMNRRGCSPDGRAFRQAQREYFDANGLRESIRLLQTGLSQDAVVLFMIPSQPKSAVHDEIDLSNTFGEDWNLFEKKFKLFRVEGSKFKVVVPPGRREAFFSGLERLHRKNSIGHHQVRKNYQIISVQEQLRRSLSSAVAHSDALERARRNADQAELEYREGMRDLEHQINILQTLSAKVVPVTSPPGEEVPQILWDSPPGFVVSHEFDGECLRVKTIAQNVTSALASLNYSDYITPQEMTVRFQTAQERFLPKKAGGKKTEPFGRIIGPFEITINFRDKTCSVAALNSVSPLANPEAFFRYSANEVVSPEDMIERISKSTYIEEKFRWNSDFKWVYEDLIRKKSHPVEVLRHLKALGLAGIEQPSSRSIFPHSHSFVRSGPCFGGFSFNAIPDYNDIIGLSSYLNNLWSFISSATDTATGIPTLLGETFGFWPVSDGLEMYGFEIVRQGRGLTPKSLTQAHPRFVLNDWRKNFPVPEAAPSSEAVEEVKVEIKKDPVYDPFGIGPLTEKNFPLFATRQNYQSQIVKNLKAELTLLKNRREQRLKGSEYVSVDNWSNEEDEDY